MPKVRWPRSRRPGCGVAYRLILFRESEANCDLDASSHVSKGGGWQKMKMVCVGWVGRMGRAQGSTCRMGDR